MKLRNIWLILVACTALALSGCGDSSVEEETVTSEEEVAGEETVAESAEESAEESGGETQEKDDSSVEEENAAASVSAESASELLLEWKTTQYFTDEEVPEEDVVKILEAGVNTTSSMNGQPWHFTAVTDSDVLEEIGGAMSFGAGSAMPAGDFTGGDLPEDFDADSPVDMNADVPADESSETDSETETDTESDENGSETESDESESEMESDESESGMEFDETEGTAAAEEETTRSKAALGDTPLAIIVSCAEGSELDAGLATQSMFIETRLLGYGAKIVSSPTIVLNGENADYYKELLSIPDDYSVVSVLLIGYEDTSVDTTADGITGASERLDESEVVTYIE